MYEIIFKDRSKVRIHADSKTRALRTAQEQQRRLKRSIHVRVIKKITELTVS